MPTTDIYYSRAEQALTGRHVCIEGLLMHTKQYSLYSSSSKEETSLSNTQYLSKIQKCIQLYSKAAAVSIFLSPIHMHCDRYFRNTDGFLRHCISPCCRRAAVVRPASLHYRYIHIL